MLRGFIFSRCMFHLHFLLHFLDFHPLGHIKQSTFHRPSAGLQLLHAVDKGRRRRAMVFTGAVFSQCPLTQALSGLCHQPKGQKGSRKGPDAFPGIDNVCNVVNWGQTRLAGEALQFGLGQSQWLKIRPLGYQASFVCVSCSPFCALRTQVGSVCAPQKTPLVALMAHLVSSVLCLLPSQAVWVAPVCTIPPLLLVFS